jgi:hypothetical protein
MDDYDSTLRSAVGSALKQLRGCRVRASSTRVEYTLRSLRAGRQYNDPSGEMLERWRQVFARLAPESGPAADYVRHGRLPLNPADALALAIHLEWLREQADHVGAPAGRDPEPVDHAVLGVHVALAHRATLPHRLVLAVTFRRGSDTKVAVVMEDTFDAPEVWKERMLRAIARKEALEIFELSVAQLLDV